MTGIGMMLKALGVDIDPQALSEWIAQVQAQIPIFAAQVQQTMTELRDTMKSIDTRLITIQEEQSTQRAMLRQLLERDAAEEKENAPRSIALPGRRTH
jgi:hypothetical protein